MNYYSDLCWDFHQNIINELKVKVVLCLGNSSGKYVCRKLNADIFVDEYIEDNNRKWKSKVFKNEERIHVVIATHPSRADWTNPNSDPSNMIIKYLDNNKN